MNPGPLQARLPESGERAYEPITKVMDAPPPAGGVIEAAHGVPAMPRSKAMAGMRHRGLSSFAGSCRVGHIGQDEQAHGAFVLSSHSCARGRRCN